MAAASNSRARRSTPAWRAASRSSRATPIAISSDYPDQAFDYAILSLTMQATRLPKIVLENLLRIGRHAIVSFPNFGHWKIRASSSSPDACRCTENLPEPWYRRLDAHLCTIKDFVDLVALVEAEVEDAVAFNSAGQRLPIKNSLSLQNLLGEKAVFLLRRKTKAVRSA